MTTVQVIKPSDEIIAEANKVDFVVAGTMRIGIKKPGVLSQYRLVEMIGAEASRNEVYMAMVSPILWVTDIDGEPQPAPSSKRELEALIQRLGEEGILAITNQLSERAAAANAGESVKN